jgi:hypothetical protein
VGVEISEVVIVDFLYRSLSDAQETGFRLQLGGLPIVNAGSATRHWRTEDAWRPHQLLI